MVIISVDVDEEAHCVHGNFILQPTTTLLQSMIIILLQSIVITSCKEKTFKNVKRKI